MTTLLQQFAEIVLESRRRQGMSQIRYAERIGIGECTLGQWEKARTNPTVAMVELVCRDAGATLTIGKGKRVAARTIDELAVMLLQHDDIEPDAATVRFWIARGSTPRLGTLERILDRLDLSYVIGGEQ